MPLYEFSCDRCGFKFEDLKTLKEDSATAPCRNCGADAVKVMSSFAPVVAGGTSVEPVDMTVGREANKRWQNYHDKQSRRHSGKELKTFALPKAKDGKFMPVMALGDKKDVKTRNEYVGALQSHVKERSEKGISQFKETGAF